MPSKPISKIVPAYFGGLDAGVILRWLRNTRRCKVVTFAADLGQGEELEPARRKAGMFGVRFKVVRSRCPHSQSGNRLAAG